MGIKDLLDSVLPGSGSGGEPGATLYRASISTPEAGVHTFEYLYSDDWEQPVIVSNENRFQMPEDPVFVQERRDTTTLMDREFPLVEMAPAHREEIDSDRDTVSIPSDFHGQVLPEIDRTEDELRTIFE
ncbi:MAG: hypothetical protein ABEJ58_04390 [Halodesulfurarchaeum sp.]